MLGYQCLKNIYLSVYQKELIPKVTPELQALFDQGNAVTIQARKKFSGGVLVDYPAYDFIGSLKRTRELLSLQTTSIFEAAFEYKTCYARADIITYNPVTQRWSIYEVKSTTKVKDEHLDDVGLQVWIMANAGLPIEKISILHLNNLCKYPNLDNLFIEEDVTDKLRALHTKISPRLNEIFNCLKQEKTPDTDIGPHCGVPRDCQFVEHCWAQKNIPEKSIFSIPGLREKKWELYSKNQIALNEIDLKLLSEKQQMYLDVLKTDKRYINSVHIKNELLNWKFPLIFLDFETISPAIPRYEGTGPFAQVPFQFSVHVLRTLDSELEHFEFLHTNEADPRPELISKLIPACGTEGSVVAYYSKFESARLLDLEEFSPQNKTALSDIRNRLVDPLPIFREAVYDSKFKDSFSIKSVGPAILGDKYSYDKKKVGDGGAAQRAFDEIISPYGSGARRTELIEALLAYCKQDTLVMVELVKWLYGVG